MEWKDFIVKLMQDFRLNSLELQKVTGVSNPVVSQLRTGKTQTPSMDTIRKLERALGIKIYDADPTDLSYRQVVPLALQTGDEIREFNTKIDIHEEELPLFGDIPAGRAEMKEYTDYHKITFDSRRQFMLRIDEENGDSMMPLIRAGDIVVCDANAKPVAGDIVAARWGENRGAVKILGTMQDDPNRIFLYSSNPAGPIFPLQRDQIALYKVIFIKKK